MSVEYHRNFPKPVFAYDIEHHSLATRIAQKSGILQHDRFGYWWGYETKEEIGLKWIRLINRFTLFAGHCDEEAMEQLQVGQTLVGIHTPDFMLDVFDGRALHLVAAVLTQNNTIYKTPDFDLEEYVASHSDIVSLL